MNFLICDKHGSLIRDDREFSERKAATRKIPREQNGLVSISLGERDNPRALFDLRITGE